MRQLFHILVVIIITQALVKNSKCAYNPTKDKIHALAVFAKDAMKNEYNNVNKELANFENMSVSGNEKDK